MKKNRLRLEMAVDRNLWRNGSAPGRPTRVGMQTRASRKTPAFGYRGSHGLTRTAPIDLGPF